MVCVAAFIILVLIGVFVAAISIFKRDFGKRYLKALKKAFHCFGKKVRLQKCDTNFSDDVKSLLLRKVILKKPKLVKPLSITIEIASVLLVILTVWSIIEAAKAGLSLWVFGTCNISQPSNCALGADSCGLDEDNLNWFTEWGELFSNIPDRLKTWNAADYDDFAFAFATGNMDSNNIALSIIDPGCGVCLQSYKNIQKSDTFLKNHQLRVVLYPIKNTNGELRFTNSELITRFILAANQVTENLDYSEKIINRIFTEYDENGNIYQNVFNNELSADAATDLLSKWLAEWGIESETIVKIRETANSQEITNQLNHNIEIINTEIKPKGIPTMIYDGKKHLGLYK
ncbi:hypothetical protein IJH10_00370 [Candidatus Saccharibacteria bacterium]|nr:hypothetical protein [Candidatus Saccharibacteria bacterium]